MKEKRMEESVPIYREYNTHNQPILERVIKLAKLSQVHILDVGCGTGEIGKYLLDKVDCMIDGIETNNSSILKAKELGYSHVYDHDLNTPLSENIASQKYGVIILADVLEHLMHPERRLPEFAKILAPEGTIYISLPNIGFLYFRITHLFGQWNYKDYGIMDRTHLRFFTLATMKELLKGANLNIVEEYGYCALNNYPYIIKDVLRFLAKIKPSMFAMQIIFTVKNYGH